MADFLSASSGIFGDNCKVRDLPTWLGFRALSLACFEHGRCNAYGTLRTSKIHLRMTWPGYFQHCLGERLSGGTP